MEIAKVLPSRSVQSVYRHGLRILHPFRRGAWSEDEINKLFELVVRLGKKWVAIQNQLHRSADSCRDKYRECSKDFVKGRWKEHEVKELEALIRTHLKEPKLSMLEIGKMIEAEGIVMPWEKLSQKMGTRSRLSCFKKFQKMCGLFVAPEPSSDEGKRRKSTKKQEEQAAADVVIDDPYSITGDADMYLLSELVETGAQRAAEVPWESIRVDDAQERYNMLVMEWQEQEGEDATEEALTTLPLCELAQLLLDRRNSAKTAVETLEAVDLPIV